MRRKGVSGSQSRIVDPFLEVGSFERRSSRYVSYAVYLKEEKEWQLVILLKGTRLDMQITIAKGQLSFQGYNVRQARVITRLRLRAKAVPLTYQVESLEKPSDFPDF